MRNIIISVLLIANLFAIDYSSMSLQELKNQRGGIAPEDKEAFKAAIKAKMQSLSPEQREKEKAEMLAFKASVFSTTPKKIEEFEMKMKSLAPEKKDALMSKMDSLSMEEKFAFKTKLFAMSTEELSAMSAEEMIHLSDK